MAGNRDLSGGAFGPGVRPYTQADANGWMQRNVPAGMQSSGESRQQGYGQVRYTPTQVANRARGNVFHAPAGSADAIVSANQQPMPSGSYQSSINVGGGIGRGGVLAGLLDTGRSANPNVSAFTRATAQNDVAQIGRAIDAQNQQLFMDQQAKRAESTTQGASNLAQIYGDYAERGTQQIGLAAQIMQNNIGFAAGMARLGMGAFS